MQLPAINVQVAFEGSPGQSSPTWSDVSTDVADFQIAYGRQHELDRVQAGNLTLTFDNREGKYTPWNTLSPYYVAPVYLQCNATTGSASVTVVSGGSASVILIGSQVTGPGVPLSGASVEAVSGSTVKLSAAMTDTWSGGTTITLVFNQGFGLVPRKPVRILTTLNMLSAADASYSGNSIGTWTALANCGVQVVNTHGDPNGAAAYAMSMQSINSGGTMVAHTGSVYAVSSSTTYTGLAEFWGGGTAGRAARVGIGWYTSAGALISTSMGASVTDSLTGWTGASVIANSPSNAAGAALVVESAYGASLELAYVTANMLASNAASVKLTFSTGVGALTPTQNNVFYGYADSWIPSIEDALNQTTKMQAYDALKLLSLKYLANSTLYPNTILSNSPLAYYRLNDAFGSTIIADSSGNGHNAMLYGSGATYGLAGAILYDPNAAMGFGGSTTSPNGGAAGLLTPILAPSDTSDATYSFEAWMNFTSASTQSVMQWPCQADLTSIIGIELLAIAGILTLSSTNETTDGVPGDSADILLEGPLINDGTWHYAAVTYNYVHADVTSTWNLYVDGVHYGSTINTGASFQWGGDMDQSDSGWRVAAIEFAEEGTNNNPSFDGSLDEVAAYNTVLSSGVIGEHFTAGGLLQQSNQPTGERIDDVLTIAGFGSWPQSIATGTVTCQGETQSTLQTTALDYILNVNDTENGLFYQDMSGNFIFRDRHYCLTNTSSLTSQAIFGDNTGTTNHYTGPPLQIAADELDLWTDVQVQRNTGTTQAVATTTQSTGTMQEASNTTSQALYGYSSLQRASTVFDTDANALALAQWLLYLYGTPLARVRAMAVDSVANGGVNMQQMFSRILLDRLTIQRQGPGESLFSQDSVIEKIAHQFQQVPGIWTTTFNMSPQEIRTTPFIFGKSGQDTLDGNAILPG